MSDSHWWQRLGASGRRASALFLRDVCHGLIDVSHNMLALLGLVVTAALVCALGRPDLRQVVEHHTYAWLQERANVRVAEQLGFDVTEVEDAGLTAIDPQTLSRSQVAVVNWLSRRYRVAPEPIARLVQESWQAGLKASLDPTLILAVVAVESNFNPFAQSNFGAQGLMQVVSDMHSDKYQVFGGKLAAFDPVTNLRVGVRVLKDAITRTGSLEAGLRQYAGADTHDDPGGYAQKVLSEQHALARVAGVTPLALGSATGEPTVLGLPTSPARRSPVALAAPAAHTTGPFGQDG